MSEQAEQTTSDIPPTYRSLPANGAPHGDHAFASQALTALIRFKGRRFYITTSHRTCQA